MAIEAGQGVRPRVVIVWAGFGGLEAARRLADQPIDVTIIDFKDGSTLVADTVIWATGYAVALPAVEAQANLGEAGMGSLGVDAEGGVALAGQRVGGLGGPRMVTHGASPLYRRSPSAHAGVVHVYSSTRHSSCQSR